MKKINDLLISNIKSMKGNLICFGIKEDKIIDEIKKNNQIQNCDLLNNDNVSGKKGKGKNKIFLIKNLRKKYKKKKNNYMIVDIKEIILYKKSFVKDSIYINKNKIYLYILNEEYDVIVKMYQRYHIKMEEIKCSDGVMLIIDTSQAKTNKIKDVWYYILDTVIDIYNFIGDILVS